MIAKLLRGVAVVIALGGGGTAVAGCFGGGSFPVVKGADDPSFGLSPDHHVVLEHTVALPGVTAEEAFHLVEYMSVFYRQTSGDHRVFALDSGTPQVALGSLIDCREERQGQVAMHKYRVTRFERDRYVRLVSDPSTIKAGSWNVPTAVVAEYIIASDVQPVTFTTRVTLAWGNDFAYKQATGSYHSVEIWGAHVREETEGALAVIRSPAFQAHRRSVDESNATKDSSARAPISG